MRETKRGTIETYYPAPVVKHLAGTRLNTGVIISGDDAPAWLERGETVKRVHILCSAQIAAGAQVVEHTGDRYRVAVCLNGRTSNDVAHILRRKLRHGFDIEQATGLYEGEVLPTVVVSIVGDDILRAHEALLADLSGFECFAVFAPLGVAS